MHVETLVSSPWLNIAYVGGPTAILEIDGLRLLTDPTFDPAGSEYKTKEYTLHKLKGPAIAADAIGHIDAVLLSHDQHFDNLDRAGREFLPSAGRVITTAAGAERLLGPSTGLAPWQLVEISTHGGRTMRVTGTPARHGPAGGDRGPVTGFVLTLSDDAANGVYISGDTVWYEGVAEVAKRFAIGTAILFMGAARVREVGPAHLTMTAAEGVHAARAFPQATITPLHYEGWEHYSESREVIQSAFDAAGLAGRLCWP